MRLTPGLWTDEGPSFSRRLVLAETKILLYRMFPSEILDDLCTPPNVTNEDPRDSILRSSKQTCKHNHQEVYPG